MAVDGFVIGFSEDTTSIPDLYWTGNGVEQTDALDNALFLSTLSEARLQAGTLQTSFTESHVEAYPVSKSIVHSPALTGGI